MLYSKKYNIFKDSREYMKIMMSRMTITLFVVRASLCVDCERERAIIVIRVLECTEFSEIVTKASRES